LGAGLQVDQEKILTGIARTAKDSAKVVRRLGRTGFKVNVLGLGGHTYPVGSSPDCFMSPDARSQLVHHLVASGVNYFDTTGKHEVELLSDSFRRANIKEGVTVSIHGGCISDAQWRQKLRQGIESRLDILGYTHAPLFITNAGNGDASYAEVVSACETMRKLKEEKLIRNIGLSCHTISLFPVISKVIRETDILDYIVIRFNWKFQHANEELFPVAEEHDVGIVVMKIFCWDCGPLQWERRISVFEPITIENRIEDNLSLTPAQRHLLWCVQNSPCDVVIPSMNTMREAEENIQALRSIDVKVGADDFEKYSRRLWKKREIKRLALYAESKTIREMAEILLRPKPGLRDFLKRTFKAHYKILKNEGLKKYILYSYYYRKERVFAWIKKKFRA
jgi:predicted aldo/keto reductase-like oxidoreductase